MWEKTTTTQSNKNKSNQYQNIIQSQESHTPLEFFQSFLLGVAHRRLRSAVQSLRHHLPVHDGDVDKEQQDDQEVVHEAQQAEEGLGQEVQRRHQVGERAHQTQQDAHAEHPEEAAHGEEFPEGVAQQRGHVAEVFHQLQRKSYHLALPWHY